MNKIVVGAAPSPNLMSAQSRIGSLANNKHKVGLSPSQIFTERERETRTNLKLFFRTFDPHNLSFLCSDILINIFLSML